MEKKTRIAVIGTGRVGKSHIQGILKNMEIMELAGIGSPGSLQIKSHLILEQKRSIL